jgi:hypothetical protein
MKTAAILTALLMAGCTTPLVDLGGDLGPLNGRIKAVYRSPATVDLDGHLVWDGWPLREEPGEGE